MEGYEEDPEYQAWVDDCVKNCTCSHAPCGGVMAGGLCDDINLENEEPESVDWYSENDEDFIP